MQPTIEVAVNLKFLTIAEASDALGYGKSTTWGKVKVGLLPPPVKTSTRCSRWLDHEINAVKAATVAGKPTEEVRLLVHRLIRFREQILPDLLCQLGIEGGDDSPSPVARTETR